jgi:hypothetical protein
VILVVVKLNFPAFFKSIVAPLPVKGKSNASVITAAVVTPTGATIVLCAFGFFMRKKYQKWRISKKMILHNVQGNMLRVMGFKNVKLRKDLVEEILEMCIKEFSIEQLLSL